MARRDKERAYRNATKAHTMSYPKASLRSLGDQRRLFTMMLALLIQYCAVLSYQTGKHYMVAISEVRRTEEQAEENAKTGKGIKNSLHLKALAADFDLYIDGVYQTRTTAHKPLGLFWESIGGAWGGRFKKPDGNHYSKAFRGVK